MAANNFSKTLKEFRNPQRALRRHKNRNHAKARKRHKKSKERKTAKADRRVLHTQKIHTHTIAPGESHSCFSCKKWEYKRAERIETFKDIVYSFVIKYPISPVATGFG